MSKIKNWEKQQTESYHIANYFNVNYSISLAIRKVGDGTNSVLVFDIKKGNYNVIRNFKTKKQALAYAMNYMRLHPNG